jgi:hypothetical protein
MRSKNLNRFAISGLLGVVAITSLQTAQSAVQLVTATTTPAKTTTTASGVTLVSATTVTTGTTLPAGTGTGSATSSATPPLTSSAYSNYQAPFASNSLWNLRPVKPVLDTTFVVPKSNYYPFVGAGGYSTGIFLAAATDPQVIVYPSATNGIYDDDAEVYKGSITIPHWPASTTPATGTDGHADVYDPTTGIVHSFWYLRQDPVTGKWLCNTYGWTRIDGSGWGDPAHYMQGVRAAGVPPAAGIIRAAEINDGKATYMHALAMSMTYNALAASPAYIYPATSADSNAATTNTGKIPEGALLMLPPSYDTSKIASAALKKVADTLKTYGAYVVDRNFGTPFYIYVENGTGYDLHHGTWDPAVAAELDRMRASLQQVTSTSGFIDNSGATVSPATTTAVAAMKTAPPGTNLLSMRGPWILQTGAVAGTYDSWSQSVIFPVSPIVITQANNSKRSMVPVSWAIPKAGDSMSLTVNATGGAKLKLQIRSATGTATNYLYDSGSLGDKQTVRFTWPANGTWPVIYAYSGVGVVSSVGGVITNVSTSTTSSVAAVPAVANVVVKPAASTTPAATTATSK